jgi:hypothetical protein
MNKRKKIVLVVVFILLVITIVGYFNRNRIICFRAIPYRNECIESGRKWVEFVEGSSNFCGSCVNTYSDGGKECESSNNCQGECIITDYKNPSPYCAYDDNFMGKCYASVEDFERTGSLLCTD